MKRKLVIGVIVPVLLGIVSHFFGLGIVMVALIFLGIGYFISRRRGPKSKGKDIVIRLRR